MYALLEWLNEVPTVCTKEMVLTKIADKCEELMLRQCLQFKGNFCISNFSDGTCPTEKG